MRGFDDPIHNLRQVATFLPDDIQPPYLGDVEKLERLIYSLRNALLVAYEDLDYYQDRTPEGKLQVANALREVGVHVRDI
jgi:hypothetical protein